MNTFGTEAVFLLITSSGQMLGRARTESGGMNILGFWIKSGWKGVGSGARVPGGRCWLLHLLAG